MLPLHSGAISGVTNEMQDRSNYQATVQEIRANGDVWINMVRQTQTNQMAGKVKRGSIDPDRKDGQSGNEAISYEAIAQEVQEEERLRQESGEHDMASQKEALRHNQPLGMGVTSPSVIVSKSGPSREVAKPFLETAAVDGIGRTQSMAAAARQAKVDVTV